MKRRPEILIGMGEMELALQMESMLTKSGYEVRAVVRDGEALLSHISHFPPDMILLDVNLKGKTDGIQTAQSAQEKGSFPLIFLSSCDEEATFERAKTLRPYAFLSKPIKPKELIRTVELAFSRIFAHPQAAHLATNSPLEDCLFIRKNERLERLKIEDIYYIEAARNYCRIVSGKRDFVLSLPLKSLAQQLTSNQFQRIHRSYLVNLKYVESLDERNVYINGKSLPISKSNRGALFQRLRMP